MVLCGGEVGGVARHPDLPLYALAALRAACRSETGAPSRCVICAGGRGEPLCHPGSRPYALAALRAACRSETGAPSRCVICAGGRGEPLCHPGSRPYALAALRAACRSETGAPSRCVIGAGGCGEPLRHPGSRLYAPCGPPGRVPVGDRRSKPLRHRRRWAWRTVASSAQVGVASRCVIRAHGSTRLRLSGPRAGRRPALEAGGAMRVGWGHGGWAVGSRATVSSGGPSPGPPVTASFAGGPVRPEKWQAPERRERLRRSRNRGSLLPGSGCGHPRGAQDPWSRDEGTLAGTRRRLRCDEAWQPPVPRPPWPCRQATGNSRSETRESSRGRDGRLPTAQSGTPRAAFFAAIMRSVRARPSARLMKRPARRSSRIARRAASSVSRASVSSRKRSSPRCSTALRLG